MLVKTRAVITLTICKLWNMSQQNTMLEVTFMVRISIWIFVRIHMTKAWLWTQVQSFSQKLSWKVQFLQYTNFDRIFWKARETLVKQPQTQPNLYGIVHVWEGGAVLVFVSPLENSSLTHGFKLLKWLWQLHRNMFSLSLPPNTIFTLT